MAFDFFNVLLVVASTLAASVAALSGFGTKGKLWLWMVLATLGCVVGTFGGKAVLSKLSEDLYRKILFIVIAVLGVYMGFRGL